MGSDMDPCLKNKFEGWEEAVLSRDDISALLWFIVRALDVECRNRLHFTAWGPSLCSSVPPQFKAWRACVLETHSPHPLLYFILFSFFSLTAWLNCRSLKWITINLNPHHRYEFPGHPLFSLQQKNLWNASVSFHWENVDDAVFRIGLHRGGVEYGWTNSGSWHINKTAQRDSHFPPDRLWIGNLRQPGQWYLVRLASNKWHVATRRTGKVVGESFSCPDECKLVRTFHFR